jgi:hypothetical protein
VGEAVRFFLEQEILGLRKYGFHQNSTPASAISTRYRTSGGHLCITWWYGGWYCVVFCKKRHVMPYNLLGRPLGLLPPLQRAQAAASVENISGPDLGLKFDTPVSKVLRSEAEVNFHEPTQTSAFQGTTKPTTH